MHRLFAQASTLNHKSRIQRLYVHGRGRTIFLGQELNHCRDCYKIILGARRLEVENIGWEKKGEKCQGLKKYHKQLLRMVIVMLHLLNYLPSKLVRVSLQLGIHRSHNHYSINIKVLKLLNMINYLVDDNWKWNQCYLPIKRYSRQGPKHSQSEYLFQIIRPHPIT